jgi:hypothetical protein
MGDRGTAWDWSSATLADARTHAKTDLRARLLAKVMEREGWGAVAELPRSERREFAALFEPRRRHGSTALLTVRSQDVSGPQPEILLKRASLLYDHVLVQEGRLTGPEPPFPRVELTTSEVGEFRKAGGEWLHSVELPPDLFLLTPYASYEYLGDYEPDEDGMALIIDDEIPDLPWFVTDDEGRWMFDMQLKLKLGIIATHVAYAEWTDATLVAPERWLRSFMRVPVFGAALEFLVPNVDTLSWEVIAQFREHPGSREARERLRAWESQTNADPDDVARQIALAKTIIGDLLAVVRDMRPRPGLNLTKDGVLTATSFVPGVGPFVAHAVSIEETVREGRTYRRSWQAALSEIYRQSRSSGDATGDAP